MTRILPSTPSLEHLRNQAKALLRAFHDGEIPALARINEHLSASPAGHHPPAVSLVSAQHVIAREHGFDSWPKLKRHVLLLHENVQMLAHLRMQVERFASPKRDWRTLQDAAGELVKAGEAGLEAAIEGLGHANPAVRRECAGYMDHNGTDACVPRLQFVALNDPIPVVRRSAVHSLTCQRCKPCPLIGDIAGFLIEVALSDSNLHVRREALYGLCWEPSNAQAVAGLRQIMETESNDYLLKMAHLARKHQDPDYRRAVESEARERETAGVAGGSVTAA